MSGRRDEAPDESAWLGQVAGQKPGGRRMALEAADDVPGVKRLVSNLPGHLGADADISFAAVPAGQTVRVHLQGQARWTFRDLGENSCVQVLRHDHGDSTVRLAQSVVGRVEVTVGDEASGRLSADDSCRATVALLGGRLVLKNAGAIVVEMRGGEVAGDVQRELHLYGKAALTRDDGISFDALTVGSLFVHGSCQLTFPAIARVRLPSVRGGSPSGETDSLSFATWTAEGGFKPNYSVGDVRGVEIRSREGQKVVIGAASDVRISGSGTVEFPPGGTGDGVAFDSNDGVPRLLAAPGAVITRISGRVALSRVANAHLEAARDDHFEIADIARAEDASTEACDGAFLRGFSISADLKGRSLLTLLESASHLEPATTRLPGWDLRYQPTFGGWSSALNRRQVEAEFMRELRRLAHEKGASGSARTKIGWCAQRLRHVTAQGLVERLSLGVYRLLGYGERPGPALLTWLALATAVAVIIGLGGSWDPAGFAKNALREAFGPLAVVSRSGAPSEAHDWLYVTRAVVAIPLVTGALSLRNYVRAPG